VLSGQPLKTKQQLVICIPQTIENNMFLTNKQQISENDSVIENIRFLSKKAFDEPEKNKR
jgi:hypothetical protein